MSYEISYFGQDRKCCTKNKHQKTNYHKKYFIQFKFCEVPKTFALRILDSIKLKETNILKIYKLSQLHINWQIIKNKTKIAIASAARITQNTEDGADLDVRKKVPCNILSYKILKKTAYAGIQTRYLPIRYKGGITKELWKIGRSRYRFRYTIRTYNGVRTRELWLWNLFSYPLAHIKDE